MRPLTLALLTVAASLTGCRYQLKPDWDAYAPNPAVSKAPNRLRVAVLPLVDRRHQFSPPGIDRAYKPTAAAWHSSRMESWNDAAASELYSRWLAEELKASGLFGEVKPMQWLELAEAQDWPDLVISGDLRVDGCGGPLHKDMLLLAVTPPTSIFLMILPLPLIPFRHQMELEFMAFDPRAPHATLWRKRVSHSKTWMHNVHKYDGYFIPYVLSTHKDVLRPLYREVSESLLKAVSPGGALHAKTI